MTDDFSLRRYEPADRPRVRDLHERALRASPMNFVYEASADRDLRAVESRYPNAGGEFLVGVVEGTVVATGGYQVRSGDAAELRRLRVDPAYQGQGLGERLFRALERRAIEQGLTRLSLEVHVALEAARGLYEKCGYEEVARTAHPVTDETMVHYEKTV